MRTSWGSTLVMVLIGLLLLGIPVTVMYFVHHSDATPASRETTIVDSDNAETEMVQARVLGVMPGDQPVDPNVDPEMPALQIELEILSGSQKGQRVVAEYGGDYALSTDRTYYPNENVMVMITRRVNGGQAIVITDVVRTGSLFVMVLVFIGAVLLVGGWQGLRAILGLVFSLVVLFGFILPQILAGRDPVLTSITGSFVLLATTLYLTQGWTLKTHAALLGVLFSLILTGLLAVFTVEFTRLTGMGSEEALYLQVANVPVNGRGLLLAGVIVGTLGVLDDVIVSQASTVIELSRANPSLGWTELFKRAMHIGNDHIAATINTLVLAYVGAAMPVFLLFQVYPEPWQFTVNREMIAEEIVRTLVGTLGLIAAVPITTLITSVWQETRLARSRPPEAAPHS